ncbi:unnamed protein product [Dicrocoelium dendriticum]|nr:unnamed protein product [Dicrocoelium dendriticum]
MKTCTVPKCGDTLFLAVQLFSTWISALVKRKRTQLRNILLVLFHVPLDEVCLYFYQSFSMIYMPSMMKPAGDTLSQSNLCIMSRALVNDSQKYSASRAVNTPAAINVVLTTKQSHDDGHYLPYRSPPHRHYPESRPSNLVPVTNGTLQSNRLSSSANENHSFVNSKLGVALDRTISLYSLQPELHNYLTAPEYEASVTTGERSCFAGMGMTMGCAKDSTSFPLLAPKAHSLPQITLPTAPQSRILFPCESFSVWCSHKGIPPRNQDLTYVHPSSGLERQMFNHRLRYFPCIHHNIITQIKAERNKEKRASFCELLNRNPIEGLFPFIGGGAGPIIKDRPTVLVDGKAKRSSTERRTMGMKTQDWIKQSRLRIARTRTKFLRGFRGDAAALRLSSEKLDHTSSWEQNPSAILRDERSATTSNEDASSRSLTCYSLLSRNQRVVINVSGLKFETWLGVLERHPTTKLGNEEKRQPFWDEHRNEYFFDRHRPSFEAIFNYYQYGGCIKRPTVVTDDIFLRELEFFEIEEQAVQNYKKNEGYVPEVIILPVEAWKRKLWLLFEYPEASILAFCFSVTSLLFTITSIILFCVETLPVYAQTHCEPGDKPNFLDPFFIIETICTFWFTLELIVRFVSCPSRTSFVKDLKNLVDLAAIVPYYITLINVLISFSCEGAKNSASLAFLRVIRLIRVFKLTKHSSGLQVLVLTFKESVEGLGLFLVAFIVCILLFSSTIYYVEVDRKGSQIESIPDAFWWAVITMCTVGYGDKVPKGPLGKIVGGVCAVAGVLTLAIPVPIITENFNKFYAHKTGRGMR